MSLEHEQKLKEIRNIGHLITANKHLEQAELELEEAANSLLDAQIEVTKRTIAIEKDKQAHETRTSE